MASPDVVLYTRPKCILCAQVSEHLTKANVPFRSIEVASLCEQERLSAQYSAKSFPLLVLDGKYLGGFTHVVHLISTGRLSALLAGEARAAEPSSPAGSWRTRISHLLRKPDDPK